MYSASANGKHTMSINTSMKSDYANGSVPTSIYKLFTQQNVHHITSYTGSISPRATTRLESNTDDSRYYPIQHYINDLFQDCSIAIANALEILQSCIKPSIIVHSNNNVYYFRLSVFSCDSISTHLPMFSGIKAILPLPRCQENIPEEYG